MLNRISQQKIVCRVFSAVPRYLTEKLSRRAPALVYYHMVSDEEVRHVKYLYEYKTIGQFKEDLDFLLKNYTPVSLSDLLDAVRFDRPLPEKAFMLTFDDGFREMSDIVAPILTEKGVSATFFVNTAFTDNRQLGHSNKASLLVDRLEGGCSPALEERLKEILRTNGINSQDVKSALLSIRYRQRLILDEIARTMNLDFTDYLSLHKPYLTSSQIRGLIKTGFFIGAHSVDHPHYADLSLSEQLEQTLASVRKVRHDYGLNYGVFAFPHNDDGVSQTFFRKVRDAAIVDATFGTGGIVQENMGRHMQRVSLEKPMLPAGEIMAWQYARKLYRQIKNIRALELFVGRV